MRAIRRATLCLVAAGVLWGMGCAGGPLRIGILLPTSGDVSILGREVGRGVDLALQGVETVGERQVEILRADTGGEPSRAADELRSWIEEQNIYAVIGGATTREIEVMAPVAQELERILVSPTATGAERATAGNYIFSLWPSHGLETAKLSTFARHNNVKYVTVAYAAGPYGQAFKNELVSTFENLRGEVLDVFPFRSSVQGSDAAGLAARISRPKPDAIFLVTPMPGDLAAVVSALRKGGYQGDIYAASAGVRVEVLGPITDAEGIFFAWPVLDLDANEAARAFREAYREAHGSEPTIWAAYGWDAAKILLSALEKESTYVPETLGVMRRISDFEGAAGVTSFDPRGRVVRPLEIRTLRDGEVVVAAER